MVVSASGRERPGEARSRNDRSSDSIDKIEKKDRLSISVNWCSVDGFVSESCLRLDRCFLHELSLCAASFSASAMGASETSFTMDGRTLR